MSFGQNLLFLRKMRNNMTQEELAERLNVSRQRYIAITITAPHTAAFDLIPNAYKVLLTFMKANGYREK